MFLILHFDQKILRNDFDHGISFEIFIHFLFSSLHLLWASASFVSKQKLISKSGSS